MVTGIVPHVGGPVAKGEPTVMIGFMPAARQTDLCTCVGPPDMIAMGSLTVKIGFLPAARLGDITVHGGTVTVGFPTVMIGDVGMGAPVTVPPLGSPSAPSTMCRGRPLRQQEQPMSCAQASTSMIIRDMTGNNVSEATLRTESAARGHPPGYHPVNGTMDGDIPTMLNDHGVANNGLSSNPTVADIQNATAGGNPVMLGINNPGHWVVCDGVRTNPDGTQTLLLRDPGPAGAAGCREMQVGGAEWNNRMGAGAVMVSFPD
jgi:uncharacterized Zn-binding protein involved in type VI secretion